MAALNLQIQTEEKAYAEEKAAWKQRTAEHKNLIKNLREEETKLNDEVRTEECVEVKDVLLVLNYEMNQAEYWYPPKGEDSELKETRPLEDNERQMTIVKNQVDELEEEGMEIEE